MRRVLIFLTLCLASFAFALRAPTHHSLRAEAMGNAHVAVVDDKEAIYFNYAGLTQINKLGNYDKFPETGYYPRNYGDMRLNLGGAGPFETYFHTYNVAKDLQGIYRGASDAAAATGQKASTVLMDSLSMHPDLMHEVNRYDHRSLAMMLKFDAELAFHGIGGAIWVDANVAPYLDAGIVLPNLAIDTFYVDGVIQGGISYGFTDKLSIGIGAKAVKRHKVEVLTIDILNYDTMQDTLEDRYHDATDNIFDFNSISMGIDLGALYQLTREVRVGTSLRDIYFKELAGDKITPNWTVGANYSPRFFNKNTGYGRKFNIAMDFADIVNSTNNYKPLSHINFGMEVEQNLIAWPGYYYGVRALALRLSGGFKGGYPAGGVALEVLQFFTFEFATWAEELGYYTGQDEQRIYMVQMSLGF